MALFKIAHISYTYLSITFASNSEFVQVCLGFGICDENDRHKINLAIVLFYNSLKITKLKHKVCALC